MAEKEPLLTSGAVVAIVAAFLVFMREMGVPIDQGQQDAIRNLVAVLAPIVLAGIARQLVYSPFSVETIADTQYAAGVPPTTAQPDIPPPAGDGRT